MDGRSYAIILALMASATGLTGCIENMNFLGKADVEVSAMENRAAADAAALAWNADAQLVGVMAFELSESDDPRIDADPDPGNGRAPAWWYVYCAQTKDDSMVRAFKVTADGTVLSEADAEAFAAGIDHEGAEAIESWTVDSEDAIAAAKADAKFAKVAQGFNATVVEGVANVDGDDVWWVSAMSADGWVVATIDATTAEVLSVQSLDMDFEMPDFGWGAGNPDLAAEPVHLEGEGSVDGETLEFPFEIDTAMGGWLHVEAHSTLPASALGWAILDPEGEEVASGWIDTWRGGDTEFEIDVLASDEYTLVFHGGSWFPTPVMMPGSGVDFEFVLHLAPDFMHEEDHEHA